MTYDACMECHFSTLGYCDRHSPYRPQMFYVYQTPHKCPVCEGTGKVSRPPHVPGDVSTWTDSQTGPYQCNACSGGGVLWK